MLGKPGFSYDMEESERLRLEEFLEEMKNHRARHTELITVYVPKGFDINLITKQLESERSTAANIKSTTTRKDVQDALESLIRITKGMKQTPKNGAWEKRLQELLAANGLLTGLAAVKILLTRGEAPGLGLPAAWSPTLVIYARPYLPPSPEEYATGWPVVVFPERRTTFIGRHKSLNYLFYLAARQYALDQGAREALILEADGSVSEGAATSLVLAMKERLFLPAAASALPGVTVAVLARSLKRRGKNLEQTPRSLSEVEQADGLWLANSLMGLMPVSALAGKPVPLASETFARLQECLAQEARR